MDVDLFSPRHRRTGIRRTSTSATSSPCTGSRHRRLRDQPLRRHHARAAPPAHVPDRCQQASIARRAAGVRPRRLGADDAARHQSADPPPLPRPRRPLPRRRRVSSSGGRSSTSPSTSCSAPSRTTATSSGSPSTPRSCPRSVITHMLGLPSSDLEQLRAWSAAWVLPFIRPLATRRRRLGRRAGRRVLRLPEGRHRRQAGEPRRRHHHARSCRPSSPTSGRSPTRRSSRSSITCSSAATRPPRSRWHPACGSSSANRASTTPSPAIAAASPSFVEEVLRIESPTQGLWRAVAEDTEIAGVAIPAGSTVHLRYASANRDERVFACPADVDLDRHEHASTHGVHARRAPLPRRRAEPAGTGADVRSDPRPSPEPAACRGSQRLHPRPDVHDALAPRAALDFDPSTRR